MSVRQDAQGLSLEGDVRVEDAEPLAALLQDQGGLTVDLSACTGMHAAVLQVLLAHGATVAGEPPDAFLARWVAPLLQRRGLAK